MNAPLSPCEMQAMGSAYMTLGLFARCEDLRRLDREADREAAHPLM